jgi:hypothetical protein
LPRDAMNSPWKHSTLKHRFRLADATFVLAGKSGAVECMIVRAALEAFFGLPTEADEAKMRNRPRCGRLFTMAPTVSMPSLIASCSRTLRAT